MKIKIKFILDKYSALIVFLFGIFVSISSFLFYYSHHLTLFYGDETSHLNISRHIFDSLTPGIVQLGSVWLPMFQILEAPLSLNYALWQTGIAGSIVSMLCFIFSVLGIYKTICYITNNKVGAWIGVLVFVTNANVLYFQNPRDAQRVRFSVIVTPSRVGSSKLLWFMNEHLRYNGK